MVVKSCDFIHYRPDVVDDANGNGGIWAKIAPGIAPFLRSNLTTASLFPHAAFNNAFCSGSQPYQEATLPSHYYRSMLPLRSSTFWLGTAPFSKSSLTTASFPLLVASDNTSWFGRAPFLRSILTNTLFPPLTASSKTSSSKAAFVIKRSLTTESFPPLAAFSSTSSSRTATFSRSKPTTAERSQA